MKPKQLISLLALLVAVTFTFSPVPALGQASADYALSFNGTSDLVMVPNSPLLELTDGTLELWFRPDWAPGSLAYDPALIAERMGAVLTRFSLHVDRNLAGVALANGTSVSTVPYGFTRGQWYHLALVDSGATAQVYVNGQFIGSTTNGFGTLIGLPLQLGSDGVGEFFRGQMDEVRIWSVARSATEIRYNLSRALAGTEPGLVAHWRMNEGIGLTIADATANRLEGTLYGPAWTRSDVVLVNTCGSFGTALDLTASRNTYMQVTAPSLVLSSQLTFEAWIKPRSAQCNTILARGDGTNLATTDYIFQVGTDGTNCGVMKLALMVAGTWATSASTVPTNAWTHVAVNFDGTNAQFYINGLLDRAVAATGSVFQSGSPLFIGRQGSAGGNYFDGGLDEVRVWNTARSAAQIQTNLNRALPANEPRLVGYWRFNEQAGRHAVDGSGRGNHGTLLNRPVRVSSFWAPAVTVSGANPLGQECHASFSDPGATVSGVPLAVAGGGAHSLALKADGTVIGWGYNGYGQTTVPSNATNIVAITAGESHSLAVKSDGGLLGWGINDYGQLNIPPNASNVVAIAAGRYHNLALRADGTVIAWGYNGDGQTNVPPNATNMVAVTAGYAHSLALRADGAVIGWGRNDAGQITVPASAVNVVALAAGSAHSLALRNDGRVVAWGNNGSGQTNVPASALNIVAISAGGSFNLALKADGAILAWGDNSDGRITIPSGASNMVAIAAGQSHSLAVRADGTVFAWGYGGEGRTTVPATVASVNSPLAIRGSVNPDAPGTYVLNYSAASTVGGVGAASRTAIVTDTQPPRLTLTGANPLNLDVGTPFVDPGATAADACEGDLTGRIVRGGTVNALVPGRYMLTYSGSDSSGNTATTNRTVLVRGWPSVLGFTAFFSGTNAVTGSPVVQFLADVNPNGLPTVTFAQYGLSTAYPGRTASVNLPASYDLSSFYATLDGLMPGLTYHFRIAATNSLGVTYGSDRTFTVPLLFAPGDLNGDGIVSQRELDTVLSNYWPHSDWLQMTNPASLGGGLFQFALTNAGGWDFRPPRTCQTGSCSPRPPGRSGSSSIPPPPTNPSASTACAGRDCSSRRRSVQTRPCRRLRLPAAEPPVPLAPSAHGPGMRRATRTNRIWASAQRTIFC